MLRQVDQYFEQQEEPVKTCLQFLRTYILKRNSHITEAWKYGMPFYCYDGKMFCYMWVHKKLRQPYIGIVEGNRIDNPDLLTESRARMKIFPVDPERNLPIGKIDAILKAALELYR